MFKTTITTLQLQKITLRMFFPLLNFFWMIVKAQIQTVGKKTVISGLRWYTSDRYGILITVGGDFSQTGL